MPLYCQSLSLPFEVVDVVLCHCLTALKPHDHDEQHVGSEDPDAESDDEQDVGSQDLDAGSDDPASSATNEMA